MATLHKYLKPRAMKELEVAEIHQTNQTASSSRGSAPVEESNEVCSAASTSSSRSGSKENSVRPRNKFQKHWGNIWPWLQTRKEGIADSVSMYCKVCTEAYPSDEGTWMGRGCTDFKTSALRRHAASNKHTNAITRQKCLISRPLPTAFSKIFTTHDRGVIAAMRVCYFLSQHKMALSQHANLMDLLRVSIYTVGCS